MCAIFAEHGDEWNWNIQRLLFNSSSFIQVINIIIVIIDIELMIQSVEIDTANVAQNYHLFAVGASVRFEPVKHEIFAVFFARSQFIWFTFQRPLA